jgi:hypothetical protein
VSIFTKKFETMLSESPMIQDVLIALRSMSTHATAMAELATQFNERVKALESRVAALESQVSVLASSTRSLMETVTQLVHGHTTNRTAIEDLYNFVTGPGPEDQLSSHDENETCASSSEDAEAYKKTLN